MNTGNEKNFSYNINFAKNINIFYSGIVDRFNFLNFMESYNLNINVWQKQQPIMSILKIDVFLKI